MAPGFEDRGDLERSRGRPFRLHILDVQPGKRRTLPGAGLRASAPTPTGRSHPDFRRLHDTRPGYGYAGIPDPNQKVNAPDDAGIWRIDLRPASTSCSSPFAEGRVDPDPHADMDGSQALVQPPALRPGRHAVHLPAPLAATADRAGLHARACSPPTPDGTDLYVLDPYGNTSHFIWRDPQHILAWAWHPSARRQVLPLRGPDRPGRGGRRRT